MKLLTAMNNETINAEKLPYVLPELNGPLLILIKTYC